MRGREQKIYVWKILTLTAIVEILTNRAELENAAIVYIEVVGVVFIEPYIDELRKLKFSCKRKFRITKEGAEPGYQQAHPIGYAYYLNKDL